MCKSINIKEAQNYEATAGTRTAGQLKYTNVRYLTFTLARIASESSRAPSRPGTRYRLFSGKAVYPHPGLKSPTQSKTITNLRVREEPAWHQGNDERGEMEGVHLRQEAQAQPPWHIWGAIVVFGERRD
jgi:hypothetical protein